ncbi:helix-turn-helix transcriptional regulator [Falsigemmobacter faecalis]|uniref:HTH luxR-type domain-containing protein n=1 Tax=Falsigemmobacter faecalis TaxID=2488730 RepID=A0A3P3DVH5_9RHOB|nr:LuxR C-terminal-related transcriptional regulator [Falsigemmobacter faecalis]RRH78250.1 hypothetical protein EG244_02055 [Falsigemmobacter faecalis]
MPETLIHRSAPPVARPPPTPVTALVARPRLTTALLNAAQGLTVLAAPPGCGKTSLLTLLAAEAEARGMVVHQLTAPCPQALLAGLAKPGVTPGLWLISGTAGIDDDSFAARIAPALLQAAATQRLILAEPRLRSAALRQAWLRQDLSVISAADLRFDETEARALLGPDLSAADLRHLLDLSGGWIAALRHLPPGTGREAPLPPVLSAWYEEEICARLDPATLRLVMDLALAQRFSPALLDALPPHPEGPLAGWEGLAPLLRDGVLLQRHGRSPGEFRLQPAFAHHLRERLRSHLPTRATLIGDLMLRWWESRDNRAELARHALSLDDTTRAAELLEAAGGITTDMSDGPDFARDLPVCTELARDLPLLFLSQIYHRSRTGRLAEAELLFEHARRGTKGFTDLRGTADPAEVLAWARMLEMIFVSGSDRPVPASLITDLRDSLAAFVGRHPVVALSIASVLAWAEVEDKDFCSARRTITLGQQLLTRAPQSKCMIFLNIYLARCELATGSLPEALSAAARAVAQAEAWCTPGGYEVINARIWQGICLAEAGQTAGARPILSTALAAAPRVFGYVTLYAEGWSALARILATEDGPEAARAGLSAARRFAHNSELPRLALCLDQLIALNCDGLLPPAAAPLAQAALALKAGRAAEAAQLLDTLPAAIPDQRERITALILRIRAGLGQRRYSAALTAAEELLPLLSQSGNRRLAAEAMPWLLSVRSQCHRGGRALSPHALAILDRLSAELPAAAEAAVPSVSGAGLLSPREGEIIALVAEGLITKEIARRLGISEGTVKSHRKKIHEKLDVTSRSQAILKARELQLI